MIIDIPGMKSIDIKNIVLDYNGTIALDGKLLPEVESKIVHLSKEGIGVHILTADTHDTVQKQCGHLPANIKIFNKDNASIHKGNIVDELGGETCISIGNGYNDGVMFEKSTLGIIILGQEGCSTEALMKANILCRSIEDAFDMIIKKERIIATLRG